MADDRIKGLSAILKLAQRRSQVAQDRAALAEQRYEAALRASQQAREDLVAMQENYRKERGERVTRLMEAPASQIQLSQVRIAYDIDAQRLLLQRQKIQLLKDEEGARLMEKDAMRKLAIEARKREQKLEEALNDMRRQSAGLEEVMSEMEAEQ